MLHALHLAHYLLRSSGATSPSTIPQLVSLDGRWRLTQPERKLSVPATVPGVAQADLLAAGRISDPFYRDNDKQSLWVGQVPWTYSRAFTVTPDFTRHEEIRLRCEGLDTLSDIHVNGREVAHTDNMYRTWEFDVKPLLHPGVNTISVTFSPIQPYLDAHVNQAAFPGKPVQAHGWGYVRKPSFEMGWDFSPELITCGIWRNIGLIGWDEARLTNIDVVQNHTKPGQIGLAVSVAADTAAGVRAHISVLFHGQTVAESSAPVIAGAADANLTVEKPQLWWPNGMGPQNLYTVSVSLTDARRRTVDTMTRTIGLRTVTWIPKTDAHPLMLEVNDRPFFAKGTNWVPCDSLVSRASPARERQFVDNAVAANMNLVRLWGGGYYEDDALFDECDRKGLMTWAENKFADATYPAFDPKWMANVKAEEQDDVRRIGLHPSIAVWSGNNEVIGFVRPTTSASGMAQVDYDHLFHQLIPNTLHSIAPGAIYTPGSPESGDEHDWSVWHGDAPFESYRTVHGFISEFGFQAFPQPLTVNAFTNAQDRATVESPVMEYHQRNWRDGNALILTYAKQNFHRPKDFESTLWLSQIQQAYGVLIGVENWRRDWPHSTGSLVWQYDDPWPGISWAMVDYYGRPKALWYRLSHAYAPVMLSGLVDQAIDSAALWVCNDHPEPLHGQLDWRLLSVAGAVLGKGSQSVSIPAGTSSTQVLSLPEKALVTKKGSGNVLLSAELRVPGEPESSTMLLFARPKEVNLANPGFRTIVTPSADGRSYQVTLMAARPALYSWVDLGKIDARYSDNFIDLRPGQTATITVTPVSKTTLASVKASVRAHSLYDTYIPGGDLPTPVAASANGTIVATADDAVIGGSSVAVVEQGLPDNIGHWSDTGNTAQWIVKNALPGSYSVTMNISCPPDEAGSTIVFDVNGQQLTAVVPSTGSWTDYEDLPLGTVQITQAGKTVMVLKATKMQNSRVMNVRSITLKPLPAGS